jgi:hypothetical protein
MTRRILGIDFELIRAFGVDNRCLNDFNVFKPTTVLLEFREITGMWLDGDDSACRSDSFGRDSRELADVTSKIDNRVPLLESE